MALFAVDGPYGSGKSSFLVYIAKNASRLMGTDNFEIISNIKMEPGHIKNYHFMEDDKLLQTMRTVSFINDLERILYGEKKKGFNLIKWIRGKFKRYLILVDESGTVHNKRLFKEFSENNIKYINQCRKMNMDIYLGSVEFLENEKQMRTKVEFVYYVENFVKNFPILENIGVVRRRKVDEEGKILIKQKLVGKDENGNPQYVGEPQDWYFDWFYKPFTWDYYDDWHKNIKDKDRYNDLNYDLIRNIFTKNKDFKEALNKFHPVEKERIQEKIYPRIIEEKTQNNFKSKALPSSLSAEG